MKKLVIFCLLITSAYVQAQDLTQTVKGEVIDQQSGGPVIGAIIRIVEHSMAEVTGMKGNFSFSKVPVGRVTISIKALGYEDKVMREVLVSTGKETILKIPLLEKIDVTETVDIVIEKNENKGTAQNEMASVSSTSISTEETKRTAASFSDPARAVVTKPGVATGDDGTNEIIIRGNSPSGVLWRIEGIEIPSPSHFSEEGASSGGISMLSSNVMDNSDFYTGAFPSEYGNALSGVFDISLREGNAQEHEFSAQLGILGVAASAEGPLSKKVHSSYLVNYRYSTLALFDDIGVDLLGSQEDLTFDDLSWKLQVDSDKLGDFSFWGVTGRSGQTYRGNGIEIENGDTTEDYTNDKWNTGMMASGITHRKFLSKNTYLKTTLAVTGRYDKFNVDSLEQKDLYEENLRNNSFRLSTMLNSKINSKNTIRGGVIASQLTYKLFSKYRDYEEETGFGDFFTQLDSKGNALMLQSYAQWQHRASEKLTLNTGFHSMYFDVNKKATFEPRFGMVYKANSTNTFTGGIGFHSRFESLSFYNARYDSEDGAIIQPNKEVDFTKSVHFVSGYQHDFSKNLRLKTEVYYQHMYNVPIRPSNVNDAYDLQYSALNSSERWITDSLVNEGTGYNYGLEVTLERSFADGLYFFTTGSLFQSKYKGADNVVRNTRYNGNWMLNLVGGKEWKVGKTKNNLVSLNLRGMASGGKRYTAINLEESILEDGTERDWDNALEEQLPMYMRVDVGFSYRKNKPKHASIWSIDIQNVMNRGNIGGYYYNDEKQKIDSYTMLGMLPVFSYRLEF